MVISSMDVTVRWTLYALMWAHPQQQYRSCDEIILLFSRRFQSLQQMDATVDDFYCKMSAAQNWGGSSVIVSHVVSLLYRILTGYALAYILAIWLNSNPRSICLTAITNI
jgi:hypothetical protein